MSQDKYDSLLEKLKQEKNWPSVYMFKFIIAADNQKIALVQARFSDEAVISQNQSSTGKYVSITAKEVMMNPDAVIKKYKEVETIEGVMIL